MAVDPARAESLFLRASDLADPAERAAYLKRECGDDAELRNRVEALLRANGDSPAPLAGSEAATIEVDACPLSVGYPMRKFVKRNQGPVLAAGFVLLALNAGFIGTKALRDRLQADQDTRPEPLARLAWASADMGQLTHVGDKRDALVALQESLAIRQKLAALNPTVTRFQVDLAANHGNIGLLQAEAGKPAEALTAHEAALAIWQKLAGADPTVTEFQREIAASHNNIGNVLSAIGKPAEALKSHEAALAIRRKLAELNPTVTGPFSELAASHTNIGVLLRGNGKPGEALKAHERALAIQQRLADWNPTVVEFQHRLALSHTKIGLLLAETGKPAEALKAYEAALAIQQKLAGANPTVTQFQCDLADSYNNIAVINLGSRRFDAARKQLKQAIVWQKQALAANPKNRQYRQYLTNHLTNLIKAARGLGDAQGVTDAENELAKLRDSDPAIVAIDARLSAIIKGDQQPKDNAERLQLAQRARDKALHATAARLWADTLAADPILGDDRRAPHRYNAACAAAMAGSGQGNDDPKPDDAARAKLRKQALDWLKAELSAWKRVSMIVESGNKELVAKTLTHWKQDTDLAGIRDQQELARWPEDERTASSSSGTMSMRSCSAWGMASSS